MNHISKKHIIGSASISEKSLFVWRSKFALTVLVQNTIQKGKIVFKSKTCIKYRHKFYFQVGWSRTKASSHEEPIPTSSLEVVMTRKKKRPSGKYHITTAYPVRDATL